MILRISRWLVRGLVLVSLAALALVLWLLVTESGTRFLLSRLEPYIPAALTIDGISGSLVGGLASRSVTWASGTVEVRATDVQLDVNLIELWALNVGVDSMRLQSLSVEVRAADGDREPYDGFVSPVPISIRDADIAALSLDILAFGFAARDVRLSATLEGSDVDTRLSLSSDLVSGNLDGRISLLPPFAIDAVVTGASTRFADRFRTVETDLSVSGTLAGYDLEGVSGVSLLDWPDAFVELNGSGDLSHVELELFSVTTDAGSALGSGRVEWRPQVHWDIAFEASGVDVDRYRPGIPVVADAAGRARGTWRGGALRDTTFAIDRYAAGYGAFALSGSGDVSMDEDRIDLADLRVGTDAATAVLNGRVAPGIDLRVTAEASDLSSLDGELRGTLQAAVKVTGTASAPVIAGTAHADGLGWRDIEATVVDVNFETRDRQAVELHVDSSGIAALGQTIDALSVDVDGALDDHDLRVDLAHRDGTVALRAIGGYADSEWRGSLTDAEIESSRAGSWRLRNAASVRLSATAGELGEACLGRVATDGRVCAAAGYLAGDKTTFAVDVEDFPLAGLPLGLPETVDARGRVYLESSGAFDDGGVDGQATLAIREASLSTEFEGEVETVAFRRLGGEVSVVDDALDGEFAFEFTGDVGGGDVRLELANVRDPGSLIAGTASLNVSDLSMLAILVPDIDDVSGSAEGTIRIGGTVAAPALTGRLRLLDGRFRVPLAGIDVTDVEIELSQDQPGSLAVAGQASSGAGRASIAGRTYIDSVEGLATDLRITGEDFEIVRLPDLIVEASPDIRLFVNDGTIAATGVLRIPQAEVQAQTLPETAQRPSRDTVVVGREETGSTTRSTRLDVDVQLGDAVSLDAFGLTTGLEGSLRLQASPDTPLTGNGRINLREGRFEAFGQDLTVERGELFFNGPLTNPFFDVRAVRKVTNISAGIHLTGTPGRFNSELYGDPPMSEAETLSYLLTGRPLNVASDNDSNLLNKAAFALGVSQAGAITSQVRTSLGLETLTVEGTLDDSRIVAGTRIGGRLLVEYGYGLTNQLGTLILKYQLNERLTLESSTGTVSTIDLKYNVRRK